MRKLKFRQARFNSKGKFKDWFYWGFIDGGFTSPIKIGGDDYQYTELKDKNGKEIFEGDIVKWYRTKAEVVFCKGRFTTNIHGLEAFTYWKGCEIIGNIYEHPKLLTNP